MKNFPYQNNWWFYFILTYLLSWPIWFLGDIILPDSWQDLPLVIGAFGPMVAALILIRNQEGKSGLKSWIRSRFNIRINILLYLSGAIFLPFGFAAIHHLCYIKKSLVLLRDIILSTGLEKTVKWGGPVFIPGREKYCWDGSF